MQIPKVECLAGDATAACSAAELRADGRKGSDSSCAFQDSARWCQCARHALASPSSSARISSGSGVDSSIGTALTNNKLIL